MDAEGWLPLSAGMIDAGTWTPPRERNQVRQERPTTFRKYAAAWLADRTLKPRTRDHYARLLERQIQPTLADVPLKAIRRTRSHEWHTALGDRRRRSGRTPTGCCGRSRSAVHDGR